MPLAGVVDTLVICTLNAIAVPPCLFTKVFAASIGSCESALCTATPFAGFDSMRNGLSVPARFGKETAAGNPCRCGEKAPQMLLCSGHPQIRSPSLPSASAFSRLQEPEFVSLRPASLALRRLAGRPAAQIRPFRALRGVLHSPRALSRGTLTFQRPIRRRNFCELCTRLP